MRVFMVLWYHLCILHKRLWVQDSLILHKYLINSADSTEFIYRKHDCLHKHFWFYFRFFGTWVDIDRVELCRSIAREATCLWVKVFVGEGVCGWRCLWVKVFVGEGVCGWRCLWVKVFVRDVFVGEGVCARRVCGWRCLWVKVFVGDVFVGEGVCGRRICGWRCLWVKVFVGEGVCGLIESNKTFTLVSPHVICTLFS